MVVQWLRLQASTAEGMGSVPGQGTRIQHASQTKTNKQTQTASKQQWDTTTYLLEWPKSRTLIIPSTVENAEQQ